MVSKTIPVETFDLVIFGATGDLASRKILPALFRRYIVGQIPLKSRIFGVSRQIMSNKEFSDYVIRSIETYVDSKIYTRDNLVAFCACIYYYVIDLSKDDGWAQLYEALDTQSRKIRAFYLSISPSLIEPASLGLIKHNLITPDTRVVVEKPLGTNLASAKALNATLRKAFAEHQIFRIDHYLGKETVQNLMALRFSNILLEPLWNNKYIDHVQITVAETSTVEGRGEYYEHAGAMRDMVQNHLMQLLCLIAMEPPAHFDADDIRNEKLKVIRSLKPVDINDTVRGQYSDPKDGFGAHVNNPQSQTESFVALRTYISNWRWSGVPFYLRTGKALSNQLSEIVVVFKHLPHTIFPDLGKNYQNKMTIRLQPKEGITLQIGVKEPGPGGMRLMNALLDMSFAQLDGETQAIDAYERLIMDTIRGNQTLFMRGDELEAAWQWVDGIIEAWQDSKTAPCIYKIGSSGPEEAIALMARDHRRWEYLGDS